MSEKVIKLAKPIKKHGENGPVDTDTITLREPSSDEVFDLGFPFRFVEFVDKGVTKSETVVDGPVLKAWVCRLSGIDPAFVGAIPPGTLQDIISWLGDELKPVGDQGKN